MKFWLKIAVILQIFISSNVYAENARIAVTSNFASTMKLIAAKFEQQTGHHLVLSFGSTGKQFAQINQGAPFDAWLAADAERPQILEQNGKIIAGSRFTYALGQLVLWSQTLPLTLFDNNEINNKAQFQRLTFDKLAIANPRLAPYGLAAQQTLEHLAVWQKVQPLLIQGENISQTLQFALSGNVSLAFVAKAQIVNLNDKERGYLWLIPQQYYQPIVQQAVLLTNNHVAAELMRFMTTDDIKSLMVNQGYQVQ